MLSSKSIAKILLEALRNGVDPTELANSLADKMAKSSQRSQLRHILFYLDEYARREKKEQSFTLESASLMPTSILSEIGKTFGVKEGSVELAVDPGLIGGFRVRYGDILYDATLATRLGKLKEALN